MFRFNFDKRILYIILGIIVLSNIANRFTDRNSIVIFIISLPAILISITLHEFAHAFVADKLGDDTPRTQGRLSLNPLRHLDPVGSCLLVVAGFGWGKPVQINPLKFRRDISMSKGEALVSIAGPITNFLIAIFSAIVFALLEKYNVLQGLSINAAWVIAIFFLELILINVGLGLFNLIPLPPLDGSKILKHFLPYNAKAWFEKNELILYFIFIILWVTGITDLIISPAITKTSYYLISFIDKIFETNLVYMIFWGI